jgi:cyclopropane fatty-acyl-phospholipid synthase-like methyltransferase
MNASMKEHWDEIYEGLDVDELTWYEEIPEPSIRLLSKCHINKDESILDVGAGASTFIDYLLNQGFKNIIAADISETALNKSKERLGKEKASSVRWVVDDITRPVHIQDLRDIKVWHDRAVLHFLLEEKQQKMYLSTLKKVLKNKGYVIIAAFSLKGAKKCIGEDFKLLEYFDHTYYMPSGVPRQYIYALFQKT